MNKRHPHNDIIEKKLEQLPVANADSLWQDMHSILDKKMPQKKDRRRFVAWFLISKPFLLLTAGFVIGIGSSLFFLSGKDVTPATITKLPESSQPNKIIENSSAKISTTIHETLTTDNEPNQKGDKEIAATPTSGNVPRHKINNRLIIGEQTIKQPDQLAMNAQLEGSLQSISKARPNFDITLVDQNSTQPDFLIITNDIEEKNSLPLPLEMTLPTDRKNTGNRNQSGFYTGIMTGIDLSSVNFRSAKTGSTKGFIIGYAFNNKWSVESGLLWDTKRIVDNGEHFNPPGYTPSSGITIIAVNGKSRLYELPVNVKYTIVTGENQLFATTGLSSYLMRSENYDYEYLQNNQPGGHNYLSYKNETKNWFSVVNFSIGYSRRLGSLGNIRVEPYLKLPLANLGVGKMPIMSTGLNIGFTKTVK